MFEQLEYYNNNITSVIIIQKLCKKWIKKNKDNISDLTLFKLLNNQQILESKKDKIEYLLNEFGTSEPCNRFAVGNTIEYIICEIFSEVGLNVEPKPNAKRVDLIIQGYGGLSIKYSSSNDIKLHNSNNCINKDYKFTNTLLMTLDKIYLITNELLQKNKIDINEYIKNTGDGLSLKRNILKKVENIEFPYIIDFKLKVNKEECKHRLTSKLFYEKMTEEYNNFKTTTHS